MFKEIKSQFVEKTSRPLRGGVYGLTALAVFLAENQIIDRANQLDKFTDIERAGFVVMALPLMSSAILLAIKSVDNLLPPSVKQKSNSIRQQAVNYFSQGSQGRVRPDGFSQLSGPSAGSL
jgi:hypothetical protein